MELITEAFIKELMSIGILSYHEHENMWQLAQRCAHGTGIPMAVAGSLWGVKTGTISGAATGFLAGLAGGTVSCMALNVTMAQELRIIADSLRRTERDSQ